MTEAGTAPLPGAGGRKAELQRLNVLFCLLVVFIHCASHPLTFLSHERLAYRVILTLQWLSFTAVPGFFLLSGIKLTLPGPREEGLRAFYRRRLLRIVPPYLAANTLYYLYFLLRGYYALSLSGYLGYLLRFDLSGQFYFLLPLLQFVLLAPLSRRLLQRLDMRVLLSASLLLTWLSLLYLDRISRALFPGLSLSVSSRSLTSYLFYYMAGCAIGLHYDRFLASLAKGRERLYVLLPFFAFADAFLAISRYALGKEVFFLPVVHSLYISVCALCLFSLCALGKKPPGRALRALDSVSFSVYLYHCLTIAVFDRLFSADLERYCIPLFMLRVPVTVVVTAALCLFWHRYIIPFHKTSTGGRK